MQCICLIGRHIIQVGTTIRQGKKGGYTSVNLCVKQVRPGGKVRPKRVTHRTSEGRKGWKKGQIREIRGDNS